MVAPETIMPAAKPLKYRPFRHASGLRPKSLAAAEERSKLTAVGISPLLKRSSPRGAGGAEWNEEGSQGRLLLQRARRLGDMRRDVIHQRGRERVIGLQVKLFRAFRAPHPYSSDRRRTR